MSTTEVRPVRRTFKASEVTKVIRGLHASTKSATRENWRRAVVSFVADKRSDLLDLASRILDAEPLCDNENPLIGLTIGEISVCYEALLARLDSRSRRDSGQYFTPDDAAEFMAQQAADFPEGTWLDPCCGVGNLSWHLARIQSDSADFVRTKISLIDTDETALLTAVVLLGAEYLERDDVDGLAELRSRALTRDFLSQLELPHHDFTIFNPPYGKTEQRNAFRTSSTRENFAYFMERVAKNSRGFIAVTPASYLSAPKFITLREVLNNELQGGNIYVFDNVPDTLFRGYKFGSNNTSNTNFVRAAITVSSPKHLDWQITPIVRWRSVNRARMFCKLKGFLAHREIGPHKEWAKVPPGLNGLWTRLRQEETKLADLISHGETEFSLTVGLTPRYYISAAYLKLDRGSKMDLFFASASARDHAALVLNSSIPYLWWRALDGGVTLPRRVLLSVPIPHIDLTSKDAQELVCELKETETDSLVTKLNAGRTNQNVKRPANLVTRLNQLLVGKQNLNLLYSEDMAR